MKKDNTQNLEYLRRFLHNHKELKTFTDIILNSHIDKLIISTGTAISKIKFRSFLTSNIDTPVIMLTSYAEEPMIIVKNRYTSAVAWNLSAISNISVISEIAPTFDRYTIVFQYLDVDYKLTIIIKRK